MLRYKLLALVLWAAPASSRGGWRYSEPGACSLIGGEPIISPTDAEIAEGHLEASSIARAASLSPLAAASAAAGAPALAAAPLRASPGAPASPPPPPPPPRT